MEGCRNRRRIWVNTGDVKKMDTVKKVEEMRDGKPKVDSTAVKIFG